MGVGVKKLAVYLLFITLVTAMTSVVLMHYLHSNYNVSVQLRSPVFVTVEFIGKSLDKTQYSSV